MNTRFTLPALLLAALPLSAQSYYDDQGRYQGRAVSSPGGTSYYDAQGRYQGRTSDGPNGASYYDAQGRYRGRSSR